jgi:DNA repair protein RAD51
MSNFLFDQHCPLVLFRFNMNEETALSNIVYARAYNTEHQQRLLLEAAALLSQARFAVMIVDSVTSLFRTDYTGRGELAERQQSLGRFVQQL